MMQRRIILTLLTAGVVALALGLRSLRSEAAGSRIIPIFSSTDTTLAATLNLSVGERVAFQLTITNNTSKKVEVRFPSGRTHDFAVIDSLGREVWRWSSGKMFTKVLQNRLLDAHQSITFSESWKNPDTTGTFTAVARLWSVNFPIEQRAPFVIPDRNRTRQ